ncbi:MAG: DEAD/DEAH box helicase [Colwellia sp.]
MTFASFSLNSSINKAITELNYTSPTPIQLQAIPFILTDCDLMARAQTGTGKTAAFALPLIHKLCFNNHHTARIRVLVLTPTRELAQQVYNSFEKYSKYTKVNTALIHGGVSSKLQILQIDQGAEVLIATPGRLLDHLYKKTISLKYIETVVFDEADRMLDMGFKDEIDKILDHIPKQRQTLLFSATFDDEIYKLSQSFLNNPKRLEVEASNSVVSEIEQVVYAVDSERKRELTSYLIGSKNWQQVLIFTRTKKSADELAKEMCKDGIKSKSIHGDKSQGARDKALSEFKQGEIRALVATDVAARGIDIIDLKYVINYELPYVAEDYVHRIGRTGRAGKAGIAISLLSANEEWLLEAIEKVLNERLLQQWVSGYEPNLTSATESKNKPREKQRARKKALGGSTTNIKKSRHKKGNFNRR